MPNILPLSTPATPRFDTIDLLRGLSILAVILLHGYLRLLLAGHSIAPLVPRRVLDIVFLNGADGVTTFFAISGFLITYTSLQRFGSLANLRVKTFYRIRFARIAPLLLLVVAILSALHLLHANGFRIPPNQVSLPRAILSVLTFHLNWLEAAHGYLPANWDVLWSLSIEEMFYLFFPVACLLLLRQRRGMLLFIALLLSLIVMGPFARSVRGGNEIWSDKSYLCGMDAIALGCLTALLTERLQRRRTQLQPYLLSLIQFTGAWMMLLIIVWPRWHWMRYVGRSGLYNTILPLGACLIMLATTLRGANTRQAIWSRCTAPIRWCGRHSYELYLTHEFGVVWLTALYLKVQRGPLLLWIAAMVLLALPVGALAARFVSEPLNRRLRSPHGASPQPIPIEQGA